MRAYDKVDEYLSKAIALSQVALHDDFLGYSSQITHDYLWALSEMIEKAYQHLESLLPAPAYSEVPYYAAGIAREEGVPEIK
jgi:hypothetical protein